MKSTLKAGPQEFVFLKWPLICKLIWYGYSPEENETSIIVFQDIVKPC